MSKNDKKKNPEKVDWEVESKTWIEKKSKKIKNERKNWKNQSARILHDPHFQKYRKKKIVIFENLKKVDSKFFLNLLSKKKSMHEKVENGGHIK